jgi:hypothetical protein
MSATVETPLVPGPIQGPTREEPQIEALLLDDYAFLVHLAYLILPPSISRQRRIAAAHGVVQHALPPGGLQSGADLRERMRHRVVQEAARQASRRAPLCRLGGVFAPSDAADFDPCPKRLDATAVQQRNQCGRRVAITVTLLLALTILTSLLTS